MSLILIKSVREISHFLKDNEMRQCMAEDKVKLLTIHTSKGLESPNVLLWGNFPIVQKPYLRKNEEVKVLYVGITRAINQCIVLN